LALPFTLLSVLVVDPDRARITAAMSFNCSTVGAAGEVSTLGIIGG
jgi:hypothetical protein